MFKDMEKWVEIRRRVLTGEISKRAACKEYGLQWRTLQRILEHEEPAGYQLKEPRRKPKLEQFLPIIHEILKQDREGPEEAAAHGPADLRSSSGEHHYDGGLTIVKDAVRAWKQRQAEVFVPLAHRPGEAQVDFGEAQVKLRGEQVKVAMFVMTLPYSDAIFCQVFPTGMHRGVPGGAQAGLRVLRGRAAADQLRQQQDRGGQDHGRPRPGSHPGVPAAGEPLSV